jgi:hypothetical protein
MNAAVWLGATAFFVLGVEPATAAKELETLLTPKNFPYFSVRIGQLLGDTYTRLYLACSVVALLHLMAEWLYLGKYPKRPWLTLVCGLFVAGLVLGYGLQPKLRDLHETRYGASFPPEQRDAARRAYHVWHGTTRGLELAMLAGLALYFWRHAHPPDPTRFVSTTKFRS